MTIEEQKSLFAEVQEAIFKSIDTTKLQNSLIDGNFDDCEERSLIIVEALWAISAKIFSAHLLHTSTTKGEEASQQLAESIMNNMQMLFASFVEKEMLAVISMLEMPTGNNTSH